MTAATATHLPDSIEHLPTDTLVPYARNSRTHTCLDLFGGSGTTLIACEKNNRIARLMELDPKYCDVIVRRWQAFTGKQATIESTGQTFEQVQQQRLSNE